MSADSLSALFGSGAAAGADPAAGAAVAAGGGSPWVSLAKAGLQVGQGFLKKKQGDRQADSLAKLSKQQIEAERVRMRYLVGASRAAQGGSGVSMTSGSAASVYSGAQRNAEQNAQMAGAGASAKARGVSAAAQMAQIEGFTSAASTILKMFQKK